MEDETNIPTIEQEDAERPWLSSAHEYKSWPQSVGPAPRQRQKKTNGEGCSQEIVCLDALA